MIHEYDFKKKSAEYHIEYLLILQEMYMRNKYFIGYILSKQKENWMI